MANEVLITSVVVILLVGSYLLFKKRDLKEPYTIADYGIWIFRLVDNSPCGRILARVAMKKEVNGVWYGFGMGGSVMSNALFKMTFSDTNLFLTAGGILYQIPRNDTVGVYSWNYPGNVTFEPEEIYKQRCGNIFDYFTYFQPFFPNFKVAQSQWDYPGSLYSKPYPYQAGTTTGQMSTAYSHCTDHSGIDRNYSVCQSGCFGWCVNTGLGDVGMCTKWCAPT